MLVKHTTPGFSRAGAWKPGVANQGKPYSLFENTLLSKPCRTWICSCRPAAASLFSFTASCSKYVCRVCSCQKSWLYWERHQRWLQWRLPAKYLWDTTKRCSSFGKRFWGVFIRKCVVGGYWWFPDHTCSICKTSLVDSALCPGGISGWCWLGQYSQE